MPSSLILCQRALHFFTLDSLTERWRRRGSAPASTCPLEFSRRKRQRVTWSRFVCRIGSPADILTRSDRRR